MNFSLNFTPNVLERRLNINIIHQQLQKFYEIKLMFFIKQRKTEMHQLIIIKYRFSYNNMVFSPLFSIQNNHHNWSTKMKVIQQQFHEKARTNMTQNHTSAHKF